MKWFLIMAVVALGGLLAMRFLHASPATAPTTRPAMRLVEAEGFAALIGQPNHILVDVRTPQEHAAGHIGKTDRLIDFDSPEFAKQLSELPRDKTYLIYCRTGRRSGIAAEQMQTLGFGNIVDLKGGMVAWQKAGRPVTQ